MFKVCVGSTGCKLIDGRRFREELVSSEMVSTVQEVPQSQTRGMKNILGSINKCLLFFCIASSAFTGSRPGQDAGPGTLRG